MTQASTLEIRPFAAGDTEHVIALWQAAGLTRPWNDPHQDIARKLTVQPELFLVGCLDGEIVASAMGGYDGHRGSVYYLAVAPDHQGQGFGRHMMAQIEQLLLERGCPKINLFIRQDNVAAASFYEADGYTRETLPAFGKRLIPDH